MKMKSSVTHVTPAGGNVFLDLGFLPEKAVLLLAESNQRIAIKDALKNQLMTELTDWMDSNDLKQSEAAVVLGVNRPRVSDIKKHKTVKFTIDALVDMLSRAGKDVHLQIK